MRLIAIAIGCHILSSLSCDSKSNEKSSNSDEVSMEYNIRTKDVRTNDCSEESEQSGQESEDKSVQCSCNCGTCSGPKGCCQVLCPECRDNHPNMVFVPYAYPLMFPGGGLPNDNDNTTDHRTTNHITVTSREQETVEPSESTVFTPSPESPATIAETTILTTLTPSTLLNMYIRFPESRTEPYLRGIPNEEYRNYEGGAKEINDINTELMQDTDVKDLTDDTEDIGRVTMILKERKNKRIISTERNYDFDENSDKYRRYLLANKQFSLEELEKIKVRNSLPMTMFTR